MEILLLNPLSKGEFDYVRYTRTDKQIVINPVLIIISSLLVILPPSNEGIELLGMSIQNIKITLYCIYLVIVVIGIYATNRKNGIF